MKNICLYFQVHQPFRLKRYRFFDMGNDHYYYDDYLNKHILLDFKEVTHVDSATIANLIFLLNQLQHHQKKLALTHVSLTLEHYIEIDKVRSLIHVYGNEEEALKALDAA